MPSAFGGGDMSTVAAPTTRTWFGRPPAFIKAIPVVVVLLVLGLAPMELVGPLPFRERVTG